MGYIWLDDLPIPDQEESGPMLLREKHSQDDLENISFDFRTRGGIVVTARRSKYNSKAVALKSSRKSFGNPEKIDDNSTDYSGSGTDLASFEDDHSDSAEETCSEGSTELESADEGSLDRADDYPNEDSYNSSSSYDEDGYPKINQRAGKKHRKDTVTSSITESNLTFDEGEGQATRTRERPIRNLSERTNMIKAALSVYDIRSGHPVRLFHYQQDLPVILYSSPPAIHPSKPLVAWPLRGGDVLFADYMANTYFIRGAVPSTQDSECLTSSASNSSAPRASQPSQCI